MKTVASKVVTVVLIAMYALIALYVMFAVAHIDQISNFIPALVFELVGVVALLFSIFAGCSNAQSKFAFAVAGIMVTVLYNVFLNLATIIFVFSMSNVLFWLVHMILFFIYCVVFAPIFVMGSK